MKRVSAVDRALRRERFAAGPGTLAGMLGALAPNEAMAREPVADEDPDLPGDDATPVAASLDDILGFAEICSTRGAFAPSWGAHEHDWFTPRFVREGFSSRYAHDDHTAHSEHAANAHQRTAGEHASHFAASDWQVASAVPAVSVETHDGHSLSQHAFDDMPAFEDSSPELSPEHAGHSVELVPPADDLEKSLMALLAASHEHAEGSATAESEGLDTPEQTFEAQSAPLQLAPATAHLGHHEAEAIVVNADI